MSTAPPGTTVTGLIDVSGMLIIGGEGDGNGTLSFKGMKLGGGFKAGSDSRIEVDMDFEVIMDKRARVRLLLDSARSLLGAAACGARGLQSSLVYWSLSLVTDKALLDSARCLSTGQGVLHTVPIS